MFEAIQEAKVHIMKWLSRVFAPYLSLLFFCSFIPNDENLVLPVLLLSVYSGDESALLRTN